MKDEDAPIIIRFAKRRVEKLYLTGLHYLSPLFSCSQAPWNILCVELTSKIQLGLTRRNPAIFFFFFVTRRKMNRRIGTPTGYLVPFVPCTASPHYYNNKPRGKATFSSLVFMRNRFKGGSSFPYFREPLIRQRDMTKLLIVRVSHDIIILLN